MLLFIHSSVTVLFPKLLSQHESDCLACFLSWVCCFSDNHWSVVRAHPVLRSAASKWIFAANTFLALKKKLFPLFGPAPAESRSLTKDHHHTGAKQCCHLAQCFQINVIKPHKCGLNFNHVMCLLNLLLVVVIVFINSVLTSILAQYL